MVTKQCPRFPQAALFIDIADESRLTKELAFWQALSGEGLVFCVAEHRLPAQFLTCRPEDRAIGAAHWVRFRVDEPLRPLLADLRRPAYFEVSHDSYQHESPLLSGDVRQSLLDDLGLSERIDLIGRRFVSGKTRAPRRNRACPAAWSPLPLPLEIGNRRHC